MPSTTTSHVRHWSLAWLGAATLGVLNGALRESVYARWVGTTRAHRISTATLILALATYVSALQRRWPLTTPRQAWTVGGAWTALTIAFEFVLGAARRTPWRDMLREYEVTKGRLSALVPAFMMAAPRLAQYRNERDAARETRAAIAR